MTETIACPGCRRALRLPEENLGQEVQCPSCRETFIATLDLRPAPARPPSPPPKREGKPPRHPLTLSLPDEDEDYRGYGRPHRGGLILALGIVSFLLCFIPPATWVLGGWTISQANTDLVQMGLHNMDRSGKGLTQAGKAFGWAGVILSLLYTLFCCLSVMNY
jgi:hypothetical protein